MRDCCKHVFRHLDGVAAALRPIRRRAPQLSELSPPEDLHQLATLVRDRFIDRETAIRTATDPKVLLHLLE